MSSDQPTTDPVREGEIEDLEVSGPEAEDTKGGVLEHKDVNDKGLYGI